MSETKRLWWVRHAPTHAKSMVGWSDIPADLSDSSALARLSDALPEHAPVVSSTLQRASKTASAIAGNRPILPQISALREIHFGQWENLTFDEASKRDPAQLRAFWDEAGDVKAPDGESWNDLRNRVDHAADQLLERAERDIIVVAHFGAILCQVQRALNISTSEAFAQKISNLSITCIEFSQGWRLISVNKSA